jgi:hypothetical protein
MRALPANIRIETLLEIVMDRAAFWKQIGKIDQDSLKDGHEEGALEPLLESLAGMKEKELFDFEEQLSQVLYALDGRKWFEHAGENDTNDRFLYARCHVVAMGEAHYNSVLKDPSKFPAAAEERCESLTYAASEAWEENPDNDDDEWEFEASVSYETGSNKAQW